MDTPSVRSVDPLDRALDLAERVHNAPYVHCKVEQWIHEGTMLALVVIAQELRKQNDRQTLTPWQARTIGGVIK